MTDAMFAVLRLCLLVLVYLFFLRVIRAVWVEVKAPQPPAERSRRGRARRRQRGAGSRGESALVVVEPPSGAGRIYHLGTTELTIGRAPTSGIPVDDTYVSQLHARVWSADGQVLVEDLGSTNGTYLNHHRVTSPMVMQRGDRLQVGTMILEMQ